MTSSQHWLLSLLESLILQSWLALALWIDQPFSILILHVHILPLWLALISNIWLQSYISVSKPQAPVVSVLISSPCLYSVPSIPHAVMFWIAIFQTSNFSVVIVSSLEPTFLYSPSTNQFATTSRRQKGSLIILTPTSWGSTSRLWTSVKDRYWFRELVSEKVKLM